MYYLSFWSFKLVRLLLIFLITTQANAMNLAQKEIAILKQELEYSTNEIISLKRQQKEMLSSFESKALDNNKEIKNDPYKDKKLSFKEGILTNTSGVNNKKHSFVSGLMDFKIMNKDISIRPYLGFGYAFNATNYGMSQYVQNNDMVAIGLAQWSYNANGNTNASSVLPSLFHQFGGLIGFVINDKILIEFSGYYGLVSTNNASWLSFYNNGGSTYDSYSSSATISMNTIRATLGYILGEEIFGKYGNKNKLIFLVGLAIGIYNNSFSDSIVGNGGNGINNLNNSNLTINNLNSMVISPETGLAYQRYITDHFSLRIDARINGLGANGGMAINGTIMASMLFHV